MNKLLLGIIGGVVVVGGVAFYAINSKKDNNQMASESEEQGMMQEENNTAQPKSLKDMLGYSGRQKCEFNYADEGYNNDGVVYVANGKMRGDFVSRTSQATINSHMIAMDNALYVWEDGANSAFKTSVNQISESGESKKSVDVNKQVDFSCESWNEDSSKFMLPSGIEFRDMGAIMQTVPGASAGAGTSGSVDVKSLQCAACDNAPADSRAQCLAALGC